MRRNGRLLCGAKTRAGGRCPVRAEPGRARCRFHGGKSTGPRTPAGRARIADAQRERWRVYRESVRPVNREDKAGSESRYSLPETCLVTPSRHRKPPYGSLRATKRSVAIVMPLRFEIFRIVLAGTLDSTASKRSLTFTLSQLVGDPDLTKGWLLNRERNDGVFDLASGSGNFTNGPTASRTFASTPKPCRSSSLGTRSWARSFAGHRHLKPARIRADFLTASRQFCRRSYSRSQEPHRFYAVAVGIADKSRVVSFVIVHPHAWIAVRRAPCFQSGCVKGVH